jgi:hypothetical protein
LSSGVAVALLVGIFAVGCGSDDSDTAQAPSPTSEATSTPRPAPIVGRWEVLRTCDGMVEALDQGGLRKLAPAMVGDYFPGRTPRQLARKADVCQGAKPQRHSHFFTTDGKFASLDQNDEQVDDATYSVSGKDTLRLTLEFGVETYRYRIDGDKALRLEPVIPERAKREALANPLEFSLAGHTAAVAYAGHTWKRVDCGGWC